MQRPCERPHHEEEREKVCQAVPDLFARSLRGRRDPRSEEHTSELQSHVNLVCRLLLEKKKKSRIRRRPALRWILVAIAAFTFGTIICRVPCVSPVPLLLTGPPLLLVVVVVKHRTEWAL